MPKIDDSGTFLFQIGNGGRLFNFGEKLEMRYVFLKVTLGTKLFAETPENGKIAGKEKGKSEKA